jgi:ankyrin repeat protein
VFEARRSAYVASRYPLHAAAAAGRPDAIEDLLLARGGCAQYVANALDADGLTALHRAAAAGEQPFRLRHNASHTTHRSGKSASVAALLDNGAAQQVQTALNPTAVTPMLLAASFGHDDCVRVLAAHNPAGQPASSFARRHPLSCPRSRARVRCQRRVAADDGGGPLFSACSGCAAAGWGAAGGRRCVRKKVHKRT